MGILQCGDFTTLQFTNSVNLFFQICKSPVYSLDILNCTFINRATLDSAEMTLNSWPLTTIENRGDNGLGKTGTK